MMWRSMMPLTSSSQRHSPITPLCSLIPCPRPPSQSSTDKPLFSTYSLRSSMANANHSSRKHTCDFEHTPKGMRWLCSSVAYKFADGKLIEFDRGHKPNAPLNGTQAITVDMEDLPILRESVWIGVLVCTCMIVLVQYGSCRRVISGTSVWIKQKQRKVFEARINLNHPNLPALKHMWKQVFLIWLSFQNFQSVLQCTCVCERIHAHVRLSTFTSCVSVWRISVRHSKPARCVMTACEKRWACVCVCFWCVEKCVCVCVHMLAQSSR